MEEIRAENGTLIAIIVRKDVESEGTNFVSKPEHPLQVGISWYKSGGVIKAHYHLHKDITIQKVQEVIHIDEGRVRVMLYDTSHQLLKSVELEGGDTIFFIDGGHGFEILEDTKIVEVKQGPYFGRDKDKADIYDA